MIDQEINWQPADLENKIIRLVPLTKMDFDGLYRVASDPLVWEQHPSSDRYQKKIFEAFFVNALESKTAFVIVDKLSGNIIGSTRFYDYDKNRDSVAIGFTFLGRSHWGGQYNKAIKTLMIDYAFQFVDTVVFHIGSGNLRSQMATTRFGAIKTKEFFVEEEGKTRLSYEYEIQKEDWMKTRQQYESF